MDTLSFEVFHGNDKSLYVQVNKEDGSPATLADVTEIEWEVYDGRKSILKKTLSDNKVVIIDVEIGKFRIDVTNQDSLINPSTYGMVIRLKTNDDKRYTVLTGTFVIKREH